MIQPCIISLVEKKQSEFNCRKNRKWDRKSFEFNPIYSTTTKKPDYLFYCCVFDGAKDSVLHARVMKNPSINQLKWNWVDPQAVRPNAASAKLNPWPNSLCVHYLLWQQPLFLGEGRRNSCPLMAHSRVTVWKVHFDLCCWRFRIASPSPPQESCLWLFDLSKDPWTLSLSVMFVRLARLTLNSRGICGGILVWGFYQFRTRETTQMRFISLMGWCCILAVVGEEYVLLYLPHVRKGN